MPVPKWRPALLLCIVAAGACDPFLSGYDRKRPVEAGTDAPVPTGAPPPTSSAMEAGTPPATPDASGPSSRPDAARITREAAAPLTDAATDLDAPVEAGPRCTTGLSSTLLATVARATDLGVLQHSPSVFFRDGGATGLVDGKPLWVFHDTFLRTAAADGALLRLATAGVGDVTNPLTVTEVLDAKQAPGPLLSLTPAEVASQSGDGGVGRLALWPNTVVFDGTDGLVFYLKAAVRANGTFAYLGTGIATLHPGSTIAVRAPELLFGPGEPKFNVGGLVQGRYLYLYACGDSDDQEAPCFVGRAPSGAWATRSAYRFWDGCAWVADVGRAARVMTGVPGELTVSYNAHLGAYLAVYTAGIPNDVVFRTAPRPEGPWSAAASSKNFTQPVPDPSLKLLKYGAKEHPEFSPDGGKTIFVSYPVPLTDGTNLLHMIKVTLD